MQLPVFAGLRAAFVALKNEYLTKCCDANNSAYVFNILYIAWF